MICDFSFGVQRPRFPFEASLALDTHLLGGGSAFMLQMFFLTVLLSSFVVFIVFICFVFFCESKVKADSIGLKVQEKQ